MTHFPHMSEDALWKRLEDASDSERPELLQQLGWRAVKRSEFSQAMAYFEEARAGFEKIGCSADVRMCTHLIARCASEIEDHPRSIAEDKELIRQLEEQGPLDELGAKTLDSIGCALRDLGRHSEACEYFSQAARVHEVNSCRHWTTNSALKWIKQIRRTHAWGQIHEATELVLRSSKDLDDHIFVLVSRILAACSVQDTGYDVDVLLAKAQRLNSAHDDIALAFEISLAEIAVLRSRGKDARAEKLARDAREAARETEHLDYQTQFIIAEADAMLQRQPEAAWDLLLIAQDLGEVLKDSTVLDHVSASMMEIREMRLADPQPSLWDAAEGSDAA